MIYVLLINYHRYLYPYIEFENDNKKWGRVAIVSIIFGVIAGLIYDIAKVLFTLF
jgi:hypothetical protein